MHTEPVFIEPFDLHLFNKGEHYELYRVLGAHPFTQPPQPGSHAPQGRKVGKAGKTEQEGRSGFRFAVWAPNAKEVCVVGEFTFWG